VIELKVCFVDTLGLCYDGTTLTKRGLGGSESAVILMSRELAKLGFEVTVFNDCVSDDTNPGIYNGVTYCTLQDVEQYQNYFDIYIASRSVVSFAPNEMKSKFKWAENLPNLESVAMTSKHRVLWMHDTFCDGDDLIEDFILQGRIHEIFTLSDWHTTYITNCDHGKRRNYEILKKHIFQTRNGIQLYHDFVDVSKKDPNLFVYNASVTKGMIPLVNKVWPLVKSRIPNAKLKVIGGYYRFRSSHGPDEQELTWRKMVDDPIHAQRDIEFTGIISQKEIADILAQSSYMIYPSAFPETFGISTLESLAYNTPLLTCTFGALEETAVDITSYKVAYPVEPNWALPWINTDQQAAAFADMVVNAYSTPYLHQQKMYACNQVKDICTWDTVALQWKQHFYKLMGDFLPIEEYRKVTDINNRVHKVFGRRFNNYEESNDS
jgi:glycosyltransferase involved in cell wall biosynthesis